MINFQYGYLSKELISTSKTNGWTIHLEQFETKLPIFLNFYHINFTLDFRANKWEKMRLSIWWGTEQKPNYSNLFLFNNWSELNISQYMFSNTSRISKPSFLILILKNNITLLIMRNVWINSWSNSGNGFLVKDDGRFTSLSIRSWINERN